jgi:hypothetical protein
MGSTASKIKQKEHSNFKGGGKNSNINRSVEEMDSNSHE